MMRKRIKYVRRLETNLALNEYFHPWKLSKCETKPISGAFPFGSPGFCHFAAICSAVSFVAINSPT
jgi:hypothetical protein